MLSASRAARDASVVSRKRLADSDPDSDSDSDPDPDPDPDPESASFDFTALRAREFARLDAHNLAYLDYAAAALYGTTQLRACHDLLAGVVLGNPHSESTPSLASSALVEQARRQVLAWFDVDDTTHHVCFTANASAAIKLVAESYPFGPRVPLLLSADNHNSVNGTREYARRAGAAVHVLPLDHELRLDDPHARLTAHAPRAAHARLTAHASRAGGLLAFPAQSNFSGVRHPLDLVAHARDLGLDVLLDAAALASTHRFSLRACPADFTAISFYKLFGYPTGLGALIARRDALARLRRPWFAGGTVEHVSVAANRHRLSAGAPGFEDGTADFLGITALAPGFALLDEIGAPRLAAHVARLTRHLLSALSALRHRNGAPVLQLYGPADLRDRGGVITCNVRDARGAIVPYSAVESRARAAGVALRGGCFCNPGAAEAAFGLDSASLATCLDTCGDDVSIAHMSACLGRAVGAIRLSPGLANHRGDLDRAVAVMASFAS